MDNCKVIAISNRKGGVDKTTTTMNLGVGPNKFYGKKVLLFDADPQSSLTIARGTGDPDVPDDTLAAAMSAVIEDRPFNETAGIPITTGKCRMNCFIRQYVGENNVRAYEKVRL